MSCKHSQFSINPPLDVFPLLLSIRFEAESISNQVICRGNFNWLASRRFMEATYERAGFSICRDCVGVFL